MKKLDDDVREYIVSQIENVQLGGLCPLCGTGRNRHGECWFGHIVIDVRRSTLLVANKCELDTGSEIPCQE